MNRVSRRVFLTTSSVAAGAIGGRRAAASPSAEGATKAQARPASPALTLTCANYVRLLPIATGDVRPRDLTLTWVRGDRAEMLRRATDDPAVDGGETSMAQQVQRLDRGDRSLVAIPIFPLRNFTARDLYMRKGYRLALNLLNARKLGIYNWAASGAVWYRHLLRYLGNDPKRIHWTVGGVDGPVTVRMPDPPLKNVSPSAPGTALSELVRAGTIDAFFAPLPPRGYHPADGPIVRAIPAFQAIEQKYFTETGCYPPQHVIVVRRAAWERDPSVGQRLVDAFNESEAQFEALQRQYPYNSPWLIEEVESAARLLGPAYHQHGLEKNRRALDIFCEGAYQDGLTKRHVPVDEFFAEFLKSSRRG